jgi:hypothetical protein
VAFTFVWASSWQFLATCFSLWVQATPAEAIRAYPQGGELGSIALEHISQPRNVALRVRSKTTPGYLRGHVYDTFQGGGWISSTESRGRIADRLDEFQIATPLREVPSRYLAGPESWNFFPLDRLEQRLPLSEFEIWNDPNRGATYFSPLGARFVAAPAPWVAIDAEGLVRWGIPLKSPYLVFSGPMTGRPLSSEDRRRFLAPLDGIDSRVAVLASRIVPAESTTLQKVRRSRLARLDRRNPRQFGKLRS